MRLKKTVPTYWSVLTPLYFYTFTEVITFSIVIIITTLLMSTTGRSLKEFDDDRQVIIFTDDPKYALENDLFSDDRFIVSEGNSSYHDLYMMTQCDDFIISNSTFSWWGVSAWLADKGKVVDLRNGLDLLTHTNLLGIFIPNIGQF